MRSTPPPTSTDSTAASISMPERLKDINVFGVPMTPGPTAITNLSLTAPPPARENGRMSTETATTDPLADSEHSDTEAVLRHAFERAPLDPEAARRVDERAARITEQVRRTHGVIDDETFQLLLADDES